MVKEDLPQEFIDRLDHVDDRGLIGSIQLWTGARRNTATSFIYKGLPGFKYGPFVRDLL